MHFFFLAVITALTASITVNACSEPFQSCTTNSDCCGATVDCLEFYQNGDKTCYDLPSKRAD
ncbi:hypothetical protein BDR04DRAFT_1103803 [Suillus decipiens]|nr:hypothetical protein BDR04DRAFT_1103803 [Suillus decipiens]